MTRSFALMTAAAALAVAPVAAQAAPQRAAAPVAAESEEFSGRSLLLPIAIAIGLIIAIYLVIESEDDIEVPFSP